MSFLIGRCRLEVAAILLAGAWTGSPALAQKSPQPVTVKGESADMPSDPSNTEYVGKNRLAGQTSPYLLQHAHNPVHWLPWGKEAFELARRLDRPIFLSVGYSTCYWCHVMERESFESEQIAKILNEKFICVKLDREERPDIDEIYMVAVQVMNQGQGGWPMSVFLEPKTLKPFLAGTYYPPTDAGGRPGFTTVLNSVHEYWTNHREPILKQADAIAELCSLQLGSSDQTPPLDPNNVAAALATILSRYDSTHGGFGGAPKFPMASNLDFLIDYAWNNPTAQSAIRHTLDRMAMGGMYDQVGGGFHRYSTDGIWLVPHFEKMTYDNGQLASVYANAFEKTSDPYYAEIASGILDYTLREMTAEKGGFYSAQDAEVDAREGLNYLWLPDEIDQALKAAENPELIGFVKDVYGLDQGTNFQDPHHSDEPRRNVLFLKGKPGEQAAGLGLERTEFRKRLDVANRSLLQFRLTRKQPRLDDKILSGWNGLMIAGFADTGRALDSKKYVEAARRAMEFIQENMVTDDGRLLRTYRNGNARIDAFLEDYAFLIHGSLALHRATDEKKWIRIAERWAAISRSQFFDSRRGGYFNTLENQEDLFVRTKTFYDGAVPSGNSIMLSNLVRLYQTTQKQEYLTDAISTAKSFGAVMQQSPTAIVAALPSIHWLADAAPDAFPTVERSPTFDPLRVAADTNQVRPAKGKPAKLKLKLEIEPNWHINSNRPGNPDLIALQIKLAPADGWEIDVEYPRGETFQGPIGSMLVHTGTVEIPIVIRRVGDASGEPKLFIRYQACDDQRCLLPMEKVIPLTIQTD